MMKKTKYEIKIILRESMSMMRLARSRCYDEIIGEIFFHHHQNKAAELYQFGTIINLTKMFHLSSLFFSPMQLQFVNETTTTGAIEKGRRSEI